MLQLRDVRLCDYTTLRIGGPAAEFVDVDTEADLVAVVDEADRAGVDVLVIGGGSNLIVGDGGFDGRVIRVSTSGIDRNKRDDEFTDLSIAAGVEWDSVVSQCVAEGLAGVETLSGIPGTVGATPIQNIGAYGQEISAVLSEVRLFDRRARGIVQMSPAECRFGYRTSRFKDELNRYVVLSVNLRIARSSQSAPIQYAELAAHLGVEIGESAPLTDVRDAVLTLRRKKGMVLDAIDCDTWSAGSFFTNPIVHAEHAATLPEGAPRWPIAGGLVKFSAAWLIESAGFRKGFSLADDRDAAISSKHTLALINKGNASTSDVLELARAMRDGVRAAFGVTLTPEPTFVNCAL